MSLDAFGSPRMMRLLEIERPFQGLDLVSC
jgi:hypothetical protein